MGKAASIVFGAAKDALKKEKGGFWPEEVEALEKHYESLDAVYAAARVVLEALREVSMTPAQCKAYADLRAAVERATPPTSKR